MTISLGNLIGGALFLVILTAIGTVLIIRNNPGLVDKWIGKIIKEKDKALAEKDALIADLRKRLGV